MDAAAGQTDGREGERNPWDGPATAHKLLPLSPSGRAEDAELRGQHAHRLLLRHALGQPRQEVEGPVGADGAGAAVGQDGPEPLAAGVEGSDLLFGPLCV